MMLRIKQNNLVSGQEFNQKYVPLKKVSVEAYIKSFAADVTIKQIFRNEEARPIEAVYCFPIEENAGIYSFIACIDEREIVAQLKEKKQAQKEYSDALHHGHGAYLLEQDEKSPDNFIINVGALPAGKECHISISYVSELDLVQNGSRIRFTIPTTIAPRYNPEKGTTSSPAGTTSKYVQTVPYTIEFNCRVEKSNVSRISSTSHPIKIELNQEDVYTIEFAQQNTHLDRDILLDIELTDNRANTIVAVEPGALMASFTPTEEDCQRAINSTDMNNEFIFVVDCSGSMCDENKIGLAREAMVLFLKSLPVSCQFNIIRFGSNYKPLFDNITDTYNEKNSQRATQLINNMQADLGGTELLKPLQWLEQHSSTQDRARQIFLLTDGEISNVSEVLDLCRSMASSTRIFSFGLGNSPSRSLVKGLARATNGRFVFIPPNTSVDVHVGEQLQKALQSCITNVQVKWILGTEVMSAPIKIPPVYANDRLITYALMKDPTFGFNHSSSVELHTDRNRLGEAKIDCIPRVSNKSTIARLAAKALILELQHSKLRSPIEQHNTGSLQSRFHNDNQSPVTTTEVDEKEITKKRIIELSLTHQILSPHTAFIGVEKRINGSNVDMVLREVPIQISADDQHLLEPQVTHSYRNSPCSFMRLFGPASSSHRSKSLSYGPTIPSYSTALAPVIAMEQSSDGELDEEDASSSERFETMSCSADPVWELPNKKMKMSSSRRRFNYSSSSASSSDEFLMDKTSATSCKATILNLNLEPLVSQEKANEWPTDDQNIVRYLINKQKFDGLWVLNTKDIEQLTGKSLTSFSSFNDQQLTPTAIVIITLETRFASLSNMWHAVVRKARKRLLELLGNNAEIMQSTFETIRREL